MRPDDDDRRFEIRPKRTVRLMTALFAVGLALGGTLVGMGAASGGSSAPEASAPAAAQTAATEATGGAAAGHAGMDMSAGSSPAATTAVAASAPAEPANRAEPYGTHPLKYTMDGAVKVFHLTAAPVKWRTDDT